MTVEEASKAFVKAAHRATTLYEYSEQYTHLVELLEDPETAPEEIEVELDRLVSDITRKAEDIAGFIKWAESLAAARKAEAKRMADSAAAWEHKAERLRDYVFAHMKLMDVPRIDTARFSLKLVQNPPHVEVLEAMMVPPEYQRTKITIEPDKVAITKHWKETGEVVAGVEISRTERLDIR